MSKAQPKNPEDMTPAEIATEMERVSAAEPETVTEETPPAETEEQPVREEEKPAEEFSYTAIDGTVYKAASQDELLKKVTGALDSTKAALKDREHKLYELKPKKEEPAKQFENEHYLNLLVTNPLAAKQYMEEFDETAQSVRRFLSEAQEAKKKEEAVLQFYNDVPDYAKVETPEVTQAFKARMTETGRAVTADNLKLTYFELRAAGRIPEAPEEAAAPRKAPPRSPSSSSRAARSDRSEMAKIEAMTTAQLREYIEKLQSQQAQV